MDQKKEMLMQKLEERNKERLGGKETSVGGGVSRSDVDSLLEDFESWALVISKEIESLNAPESDKVAISGAVVLNLKQFQQHLSGSSAFLPPYEVRKWQARINELTSQLQSTMSGPKAESKFSFKTRKKTTTAADGKSVDTTDSNSAAKFHPISTSSEMAVSLCNQKGCQHVLAFDIVKSQDVLLAELDDCKVSIMGIPSTLHIRGLRNCTLISLPVATSVFIDNCTDCTFVLACQQLRMHSTINCRIYLHVTSRGIIEDCHGINVAPYSLQCKDLAEAFSEAKLDITKNHWNQLDDFNWLSTTTPSPNWSVIDECSRENFSLE